MEQLTNIVVKATVAIADPYFQVSIHGGPPKYSERVYCYELYHQMRANWPRKDCSFILTGELNKGGHPILRDLDGADKTIPDFLVHIPGDMSGNFAIFEVKQVQNTSDAAILKDLHKLCLFRNKVGYRRAIYLLFGYGIGGDLLASIHTIAAKVERQAPVEIWMHPGPNVAAEHVCTLFSN